MEFNKNEFIKIAEELFNIDSPSGFTIKVMQRIASMIEELNYDYELTNKGTLIVKIKGTSDKNIALSAHCDTLGLMVRSINNDGSLSLTPIGGPLLPSLDGEYAKVYTRENKVYQGTILSTSPSSHVYEDAASLKRDIDHLRFRIDEKVFCKKDVEDLGINNGDFVCYNPKFEVTNSGFLKTRFIDDKASVCILLTLLKELKKSNYVFKNNTYIYFTAYEEVGHGASNLIANVDEFVAIDMGCVGKDLSGNEYEVSICAKDSSGPYDYELTTRLINLAKKNNIKYVVDIFPMYGSDIKAARTSGFDFKGALIGPGVNASHGMERTHLDAIKNTYDLIFAYLND